MRGTVPDRPERPVPGAVARPPGRRAPALLVLAGMAGAVVLGASYAGPNGAVLGAVFAVIAAVVSAPAVALALRGRPRGARVAAVAGAALLTLAGLALLIVGGMLLAPAVLALVAVALLRP